MTDLYLVKRQVVHTGGGKYELEWRGVALATAADQTYGLGNEVHTARLAFLYGTIIVRGSRPSQ